MAKTIEKTELRKKFGGGDIIDVIYTDGTKRKIDPVAVNKKKAQLQAQQTEITDQIGLLDDDLALVEAETKKAQPVKRV